jgi:hypothetical protein
MSTVIRDVLARGRVELPDGRCTLRRQAFPPDLLRALERLRRD